MPKKPFAARYELHPDRRLLEEVFEGSVTLAVIVGFVGTIYADPGYDPAFDGLADFTHASIDMTFDEMWMLVEGMRQSGLASRGRWAFVVPSALNLGMSRMFETLSNDLQSSIRMFMDRDEALKWLRRHEQTLHADGT
jgi:hypothetical protein